ncbi:MAG: 4-hydroxybenzoate octaprenyltransferase [Pseudomonadota bacterium]|nr:4-hydroxybenzoate octaprenyltransferase [Pseudomonadota bacterium]
MPEFYDKLKLYLLLMRADRPIGSFLLLWPTLWSLWLAGEGQPSASIVLIFIAGVFVMRSAGCVINDYADRHIDPDVARTCNRPIAAGLVRPREALLLFSVLCGIALLLVLQLNMLSIKLSVVAVFLAASYPFMKRFTHLPQVYLGIAFGWSIPMAFAAQSNQLPASIWLLFLANICWTVAYDTMYAMVDREDDLKIGVMSTAVLFGNNDRLIIGKLQLITLALLLWTGFIFDRGIFYYAGLLLASLFFLYQQWLIAERDPTRCLQAFLNNNWFGAVVFVGLALDYLP